MQHRTINDNASADGMTYNLYINKCTTYIILYRKQNIHSTNK